MTKALIGQIIELKRALYPYDKVTYSLKTNKATCGGLAKGHRLRVLRIYDYSLVAVCPKRGEWIIYSEDFRVVPPLELLAEAAD